MAERQSPLEPEFHVGSHGNFEHGVEILLTETRPGSIVQLAAWPGEEKKLMEAIRTVTGLALPDGAGGGSSDGVKAVFGFAPGKFTVTDEAEGLALALTKAVTPAIGTVTDLSHGRTAIRIAGPKAEWVLSKFFAIDFGLLAFPVGAGRSTTHHDVFAQIQRTGTDQFDIYVFRSFARSFWKALCHASEEVGYEVQ
ncbi:sarcosine oxidase, gamma subunit family, heterotetrameric form [Mesorhizobium australicum WSM2073]|uniref:Sarcosine oxidase, gamma subunit family, heterotetrameric form n=1 Tax=Mesorhizobium australicum (strain HAMBI 3006 / LMG 24608 / WSM2073) TaxID=754035 RepID=L0KKR5_MESAW|nr:MULTISPECIES: sarcosine oxidase subunit gamma [Mesorhizobium]AGB45977.1 sarcosine oxidase, gamma subunit family, heterotetrameric form [Mesorhizobium australicum WSM2073]MBZ9908539.1 sarcosine oxidase subunit gamma [Mesorhizobium sp. BR115XR7A]MBZ9932395.1 sarcosine oxidase subunit gamma [Mesorhizobium sp. BR1-1-5]MBZ9974973.1 sarcosine oxidase subunit gamma [Mesorhizobium sp. BR-1-1-10]